MSRLDERAKQGRREAAPPVSIYKGGRTISSGTRDQIGTRLGVGKYELDNILYRGKKRVLETTSKMSFVKQILFELVKVERKANGVLYTRISLLVEYFRYLHNILLNIGSLKQ